MITNRKKIVRYIIVIVFIIFAWGIFAHFQYNYITTNKKINAQEEFLKAETSIHSAINQTTIFIYALKGFTASQINAGITDESFNAFSNEVQKSMDNIKNFSIAPNNIQQFVFPIEGNEATIGHNLAKDERETVRRDIEQAMKTNEIVVSGPYELRQGGLGLIVRAPIMEGESYWGLINIVVDMDAILDDLNLEGNYSKLNISLATEKSDVFYGKDIEHKNPVLKKEITFLNDHWIMTADYSDMYYNEQKRELFINLGTSLLIFLFIAFTIINGFYKNFLLSNQVQDLVYTDTLTSLKNRRALIKKLENLISNNKKFNIVFIDIDDFKNVNDILGHTVGDRLLKQIASRLVSFENKTLQVYRWSGDEFILLINEHYSQENLTNLLEPLMKELKKPYLVDANRFDISCSIGTSAYPQDGNSYDDIIKYADIAMYYVKKTGKNRIQMYNQNVGKQYYDEINFEEKLITALKDNQMKMYYQPQVEITTGKIVGVEALIRWQEANGDWISPGIFIPIAEKHNLIDRIDDFVISNVLDQLKAWKAMEIPLKISINISAKQFRRELAEKILQLMETMEINPEYLEIEITERLKIENIDIAIDVIKIFRDAGVGIALDDFGAGYSSLTYLSKLDVTTIKIDFDLISRITHDSYKIVKSIIALAKDYDLELIAEGVEELKQLEILEKMGCQIYQGFYFSEAVEAKEIESFLINKKMTE